MFVKVGHAVLSAALLAAIGGPWPLLQTVAWTNMLATNLQSRPMTEALTRTFDGKHPCSLCKEIAEGKQSEKKTEFPAVAKKIEFTHAPSRFVCAPPMEFWLQGELSPNADSVTRTPPVPPPRGLPV